MTLPMNKEEWNKAVADVLQQMQTHTAPYITPLSRILSKDHGELLGTAAYISAMGIRLLISNDHNLMSIRYPGVGAMLHGADSYFRLPAALSFPAPFDIGFVPIPDDTWNDPALNPHNAAAIPSSRIALSHAPVENEILFMKGYAWQGSSFYFGHLLSQGTAYCMKAVPLPDWSGPDKLDDRLHFAVDYRPDLASAATPGATLPRPDGFSGSLLWNTRFVEVSSSGRKWSPEIAEVTGIIWGWPSSAACLVATRAEHIHSCISQVIDYVELALSRVT